MSPLRVSVQVAGKVTDTRTRIIDAVVSLAETTGLRKLAMEEVAQRARVGRATLYKHFPGRDALIGAVVQTELAKFFADVRAVVEQYDDSDERLVHGFAHAYRALSTHPVVGPVLTLNPDLFVPYVITRDSFALNLGRDFVESFELTGLSETARPQFAEHVARAFHTLILIPSTELGLDKPLGPETYARNFLIPVLNQLRRTAGAVD